MSLRAVPPFNLYIPMRQQGEPYSSLVKSPMTTTLLETEGLTALLAARRLSGIADMTDFLNGNGIITFDCIFVIDVN